MRSEKCNLRLFTTKSKLVPVHDFIQSLDVAMQAKAYRVILLLANSGFELREPYSKALGDGIFELRIKAANNISRILYFFVHGKKIILTNGFIKKSQKTPSSVVMLAKKYRLDYLYRNGGE